MKPQDDGGVTDQLYAEIKPAVDGANYIIKHMRNKNDYNEVRWRPERILPERKKVTKNYYYYFFFSSKKEHFPEKNVFCETHVNM